MAGSPLYGLAPDRRALMRDKLAQQLLAQGVDTSPIQSPWQGVARLAQALMGGHMMKRGEEETAKRETDYASGLNAALMGEGGAGDIATRLGASGNPDLARLATQFRIKDIDGRQAAERDKAKREADRAQKEWEFQNDPSKRYQTVGKSRFDNQGDPTKPIYTEPNAPHAPPAEVAAYQFAQRQGFQGSLMDFHKAKGGGGDGTFRGNAMDAQASNMLLTADPASREYEMAFLHLYGPKQILQPDGTTVTMRPPVPQGIPKPESMGGSAPAVAASAAPAPTAGVPTTQAPQSAPVPTPAPSTTTNLPGGGSVTRTGDPNMSQAEKSKMDAQISEAATLSNALDDYVKAFEGAGTRERAKSVLGVNTPSNTAYSNAALLAKGDALYRLGVLNGPDLLILQKTLADPSTVRGQAAGPDAAKAAAESVRRLIQDGITAARQQKGLPPLDIVEYGRGLRTDKPPGAGITRIYNPATGKLE